MTEFKRHLREYAERELELTGFMATAFGKTCLQFLDDLADVAGEDPESMKTVTGMLTRLIDRRPLSAITESDFETETHSEGSRTVEIERCTRYPYLYKQDGRYWDDRAVAFQREDSAPGDRMYVYQSGNSSKQEVELPYFPVERIERL
jgi:hypothetical protein